MKYWSRLPQISVCLEKNNGILFNPDTGKEKVINATGLIIWQAMNGLTQTKDLALALASRCDDISPEQILPDVASFANEMVQDGFAAISQTPLSEPQKPESFSFIEEAPRDFDLSLTGKCNLHCAYCFYADEMAGRHDLPAELWLAFFNELKGLAVRNLTLSGGEVFMRPDLWDLIDGLIDARMRYSILTNGTLITEKTLAQFQEKQRRRRMSSIQVSIDGSCAAVHDASRGAGSFEKAIRGLRLLKEAGFPITVRVTVNRNNAGDLDNIAQLLLDDVGIPNFSTNDAMPMGTGCARQKSIVLTPAQRPVAMRNLVRLAAAYDGRITASAGSLALWRMFREMEHARKTGEQPRRWTMGTLSSCGCMFCKLAVHHDGMIAPCNMLAAASLGTIGKTPIRDIWKNHPLLKEMRERRSVRMEDIPGCRGCEWTPYCNGGCPATEFTRTGDLYRANPECCYRKFLAETGDSGKAAVKYEPPDHGSAAKFSTKPENKPI